MQEGWEETKRERGGERRDKWRKGNMGGTGDTREGGEWGGEWREHGEGGGRLVDGWWMWVELGLCPHREGHSSSSGGTVTFQCQFVTSRARKQVKNRYVSVSYLFHGDCDAPSLQIPFNPERSQSLYKRQCKVHFKISRAVSRTQVTPSPYNVHLGKFFHMRINKMFRMYQY